VISIGAVVLPFVAAWCGHTEKSRMQAQAVKVALDAVYPRKWYLAAERMGISENQLSRQVAGTEPLNLWRLADLPDEWHAAYDSARAQLRGAVVIEPDTLSLIRGAVAIGKRRMASVEPRMVRVELPLAGAK
jgi:hypothetical protein